MAKDRHAGSLDGRNAEGQVAAVRVYVGQH